MSARNNLIVPQGFTTYQAERISRPDLFERLTNREAKSEKLVPVGTFGAFRVWKRMELSFVHSTKSVSRGRILNPTRENGFDPKICTFMETEMALRPSWSMAEA